MIPSRSKIQSVGFSSVQLQAYDLDSYSGKLNMSLHLPTLTVDGNYLLKGSYYFFKPIFGDGPFQLTLYNVQTDGTTTLYENGTWQLSIF